jgi:3'-5' exoribonuclease
MDVPQEHLTIQEVHRRAAQGATVAVIHGQIADLTVKMTRDQKRYYSVGLRDLTGSLLLRVWNDHPLYAFCAELRLGDHIALTAEFCQNPPFGCEAKNWTIRFLNPEERAALADGTEFDRERRESLLREIKEKVETLSDPRLKALSRKFLEEYEERLGRTAGARHYHHATRGGLVEHILGMMRALEALATVYTHLNRDLLLVGALFHDAGKMWENCYGKDSLTMPHDVRGELLGHITIGIELINRLWSQLRENAAFKQAGSPDPESVRLHLLHLVAAHHGAKEFGSPVEPKTPEAFALHFVDNLDAKLNVLEVGYRAGNLLGDQIVERVRPLATNIVTPLPRFESSPHTDSQAESYRAAAGRDTSASAPQTDPADPRIPSTPNVTS